MSANVLVSAIVPAFNHERFVGDALRSLAAQTHRRLELIVVDDGSADGTLREVENLRPELEGRFVRVEIGTQSNRGSASTIASAIGRCQSDLIFLLDSDDLADPRAVETLLPLMSSPDVALAVGDNEFIDASGQPTTLTRNGTPHRTLISYCLEHRTDFVIDRDFGSYASLIEGNYVPNGWLVRRSSIAAVQGYADALVLDDWPVLLRLARQFRLQFVPTVLAKYRVHDGNTSSRLRGRLVLDTGRILLQERPYCREQGLEDHWWRHASAVLGSLTADDIRTVADEAGPSDNSPAGKLSRIEDLVRVVRSEQRMAQVLAELSQTRHERDDLHGQHAELRRQHDELQRRHLDELAQVQARLSDSLEHMRLAEESHTVAQAAWLDERDHLRHALEDVLRRETAHLHEQDRLRGQIEFLHTEADLSRRAIAEANADRANLGRSLTASATRVTELETSRLWRWTRGLRNVLDSLRGVRNGTTELSLLTPTADGSSLGSLRVTGWVRDTNKEVSGVGVSVYGAPFVAAECSVRAPGVPGIGQQRPDGTLHFTAVIHALEDPVPLQVRIEFADGTNCLMTRRLTRTAAVNQRAREIFGAAEPSTASVVQFARDVLSYGSAGRYIWHSRRIRGWLRGQGEAGALLKAAEGLDGSPVIVEVGTFLGCATVLLAGARKSRGSGRVHCVDTFSPVGDDAAIPVYRAIANSLGVPLKEAFLENMRRAGVADWIVIHAATAEEVARQWDTPIDMLFLDGDVSTDGSRAIFLAWAKFLRPGGILAINGTVERPDRAGSYQVAKEFVRSPQYQDIRRIDHITFARKTSEQ